MQHVSWLGVGRSACKILIRISGEREPFEGTWHLYEDNIKLIIKKWGVIVWTGLKWLRIGSTEALGFRRGGGDFLTAERFFFCIDSASVDASRGRGTRHLAPWIFGRMKEICQILKTNTETLFFQLLFNSGFISESGLKRVKLRFVSKFCDSPA